MKTSSFLAIVEARADHLRELSHHLHALNWTSTSLRDAEQEIPELRVAMAVYTRLNNKAADTSDLDDPDPFLSLAEDRADHLGQISHHMHSLDWVHASLSETENEIPELEVTMTVYRRLTGDTDGGSHSSENASANRKARAGAGSQDGSAESGASPVLSFSQFAKEHLDPANSPTAEVAADPNGSK